VSGQEARTQAHAAVAAAIFVHIPRTGGTTLNDILSRQCRPEELVALGPEVQDALTHLRSTSKEERARIRIAQGHVPYGFHELIPGPAAYLTLLREPLERVASFFHYVTQENQHYLHDFTSLEATTLKDLVESRATSTVDNFQVRLLSGVWYDVPFGELGREHLDRALANLETFAVVGLTERFDESLLLMRDAFGWDDLYYERLNQSKSRRPSSALAQDDIDAVMRVNELDAELYRSGRLLFKRAVRRRGPGFASEVEAFRQKNRRVRHPSMNRGRPWSGGSARAALRRVRNRIADSDGLPKGRG